MFRTLLVIVFLTALSSCGDAAVEYTKLQGSMLGTSYHLTAQIEGLGREELVGLLGRIEELDHRVKSEMSIFDGESQLSRINRGESDSLTLWLEQNIRLADSVSRISGGIYDITVAPLVKAWGFARSDDRVAHPNIDSLLQFVGYEGLTIEQGRVVKRDGRMQIDLNSIAKGFTVDLLAEILEEYGAQNYIVDIGGEVRLRGVNPSGEAWRIGVETPIDGNMTEGEFLQRRVAVDPSSPLRAMATSGNYRRFYTTAEGDKIVHTIDPKTGYSRPSSLLSATVLAPTCAQADAYATMLMAAGDREAEMLAEMIEGCEVYLIYDRAREESQEGEYREYISDGLRQMLLK